jgi:hypothetical protein
MRAIKTILLVSLLLSGCATELDNKIRSVDQAPTMQNKRDYLLSYSEQKGYSATAARAKFLKYGSEDEALLSRLIESCKASDRRSCVQKFYEKAANDAEQQTRSKCFSDEVCKKNLVIEESTTELNDKYYQVVYYNHYQSGDADRLARMVCSAISNNQKSGMPFDQAESVVRGISGVDPVSREMLVGVGNACWNLSYYGFKDPLSALRPLR